MLASCQVEGPALGETTSEVVAVSPTSVSFGTLQIGQTSSAQTITIRPAIGPNNDRINSITESCPDFFLDTPGLPAYVYRICEYTEPCIPGQICPEPRVAAAPCITTEYQDYTFRAFFKPTVAATTSCAVSVQTQAGQNITITLTGTGAPPPRDIDVQPTSLAFGDVRRNTTSTARTLTVKNVGGETMTVSSVSVSAGYELTGPTGSYNLAGGASRAYSVTCKPTALGSLSGAITIQSNDPDEPSVTVALSCRGVDSALDISPSPASIPTTRVGEPVEYTITLRNTGTAGMTLQSVEVTGTDLTLVEGPSAGSSLASGASRTARVRFGATATGEASGTLTVGYDGQSRQAQISARAVPTSMALTPDGAVSFGPVCVGQSKDQTFTIVANEPGGFVVQDVSMPAAPFTVSTPGLPASVQGAGASQLELTATATPTAIGVADATFTVTTDIPGGAPRDIQVSVEGLPAGISATPEELDFGSIALQSTTIGQMVSVTNCAASDVALTNARVEGADASEFAIVLEPTSGSVLSASTAAWLVVLQPRTPGPKQALFSVDHPEGTVSVMLVGEGLGDGIGPDLDDDPGRASYYTCSTAGGSASWPLAVALALVVRRRRPARR